MVIANLQMALPYTHRTALALYNTVLFPIFFPTIIRMLIDRVMKWFLARGRTKVELYTQRPYIAAPVFHTVWGISSSPPNVYVSMHPAETFFFFFLPLEDEGPEAKGFTLQSVI